MLDISTNSDCPRALCTPRGHAMRRIPVKSSRRERIIYARRMVIAVLSLAAATCSIRKSGCVVAHRLHEGILPLLWLHRRWTTARRRAGRPIFRALLAIALGVVGSRVWYQHKHQVAYYAAQARWLDVARWARTKTTPDTTFLLSHELDLSESVRLLGQSGPGVTVLPDLLAPSDVVHLEVRRRSDVAAELL
jgi:hypothetical protein